MTNVTVTAIDTAVIPVAGLGTRMGTFTEAVPKFMIPVYEGDVARPAVDYMLDECIGLGIKNIVFVTSDGGDKQLKKYLGPINPDRQKRLLWLGKKDQLAEELARRELFAGMNIMYADQPVGPYGTAVPLALARDILKGVDRFIVTGGDDFIWHQDGHSEWRDALKDWDGSEYIIMGDAVSPEEAPKYGVFEDDGAGYLKRIIEKPPLSEVPANPVRNISRYMAGPDLWPHLQQEMSRIPTSDAPEHYVIDVINAAISAGAKYKIHTVTGAYLDCGTPRSTHQAGDYITAQLDKLSAVTG